MEDLGFAADHLEPQGYACTPGFVKSNPANNPWYLEMCCESLPEWEELLRDTDKALEKIAPGYNIKQIKPKFGYLCFYAAAPEGSSHDVDESVQKICRDAESQAPRL